jgi:hypothetical protein
MGSSLFGVQAGQYKSGKRLMLHFLVDYSFCVHFCYTFLGGIKVVGGISSRKFCSWRGEM